MIDGFIRWLEGVLDVIVRGVFKVKICDDKMKEFTQFVKFGLVGVLNNAISYVVYVVLVKLGMHYTPANIIGFSISVFNSYYWNNKYVFASESKRVWWKTLAKTYISYASTGIVLSNILLAVWIDVIHINEYVAPLITLIIIIPLNYIVNKFWAYKK